MTIQRYDHLIIDGRIVQAYTPSISSDVAAISKKNRHADWNSSCQSNCVSVWEIHNNKVFLNYLHGEYFMNSDKPIWADWITGRFVIPAGQVVQILSNIGIDHEKVITVEVEKGLVKTITTKDNSDLMHIPDPDPEMFQKFLRRKMSVNATKNKALENKSFHDNQEAYKNLELKAQNGDSDALVQLCEYLVIGAYVERDLTKAVKCFLRTFNKNIALGNDKEINTETIIRELELEKLQNPTVNQDLLRLLLGLVKLENIKNKDEINKSIQLLEDAHKYSCVKWTYYGESRYHGNDSILIKQDRLKALFQFLEAINHGSNLGYGESSLANESVSFNQSRSLYYLSRLFDEGIVVHKNVISSYALALLARKKGSLEAKAFLGELENKLSSTELEEAKSFDVFPKYNQYFPWWHSHD